MRNAARVAILSAFVAMAACGGNSTGPSDHSPKVVTFIGGTSQQAVVGTAVGTAPSVVVKDKSGSVVSGVAVTFAVTAGGGSVTGGVVTTDAAGVAQVGSWTLGTAAGTNTLSASVAALTPVTLNATAVAGPAANLVFSTAPSTTAASGAALAQQPVLQLKDQFGNNASQAGVSVTAAIAAGGGTLGGTTTVASNASGVVTFTNLSITGPIGARTLSFTASGLPALSSGSIAVTAGPAASVAANSLVSLTGTAGAAVAPLPSVTVHDASNNVVAGASVTFAVASGGGSVTGATPVTDAAGVATVGSWTLGGTVGAQTLTATVGALPAVTFTATAGPAAGSRLTVATQPSVTAASGVQLVQQPVLHIEDAFGNLVTTASNTVTVTLQGAGAALGGTTSVAAVNGVVAYTDLSISGTVGNYTLSFGGSGLTGVSSTSIALGAGAAATISVNAGNNQTAPVGTAVPIAPSVLVVDGSGNPVSGTSVTFAVATGGGSVTGGGASTNGSGIATVGSWTLGNAIGSNTLTATSAGLAGSPVTFTASSTPGAGSQLAITTQPSSSANNGVVLAQQPVIQLRDQLNNPVSLSGVVVTAAVASGGGSVSGGTTATTDVNGTATFSGLTLNGLVGTKTLGFSAAGVTPVTSGSIALAAGAPAKLAIVTSVGNSLVNGSLFSPQPAVRLQDAGGNNVSQSGVPVTVSLTGGPGAALGGTLTINTGAAGTATYANLRLTGQVGSYSLAFNSSGLTGVTMGPISLFTGPAATLSLDAGDGQTAPAGTAVPVPPSVLVADQSGNPVSGAAVSFAVASGGGSVSGGAATTNSSGIAAVSSWTLGTAVGSNTLTATVTGLAGSPVTFTASGGVGPASQLVFTTAPSSSASNGVALAQQPVLQLQDQFGNDVSQSGVQVTAAIASGGGSVSGGTPATTNASGVASFSGLVLNGLVGTKTLSFSATGVTPAISGSITLAAGAPSQLIMVTQPSGSAVNGAVFATQPVVRITDAGGNFALQSGTNVTVAIASGGGALGGSATVATDGSGIATFSGLSITGLAGNHTLSFSAGGLNPATSSLIAITASAATTIAISAGNNQTGAAGSAVAVAPATIITDQSGNPVSGIAVTFAVATGGSSVVGGAATSNASGIAAVTSWTLGTVAGGNTLTATATGLAGSPLTFTATATAAPASQFSIVTQPSSSASNGIALAQQPVLQLKDQFGNDVSQAGVLVTAAVASGGGSVSGGTTATTNASGVASFSGLIVNGLVGTKTLSFSATGITLATSGNIALAAGAAAKVVITTQPSASAINGGVFTTQPVVQVTDAGGNVVLQAGTAVTVAIASGGGSLGGSATANTDGTGTATFSGLSITGVAGNHTLAFSSSGLASGTSNTIAITSGPATSISLSSGDGQSAAAGTAVVSAPTVFVGDQSGNPVSGVGVTFVVATGGGSITGGAASTSASGLAHVGSWTLGTTAGPNSLTATSGVLGGSPVTFTATGVAGAPSQLSITTQPSSSASNGIVLAQQPVLQLKDQFGNDAAVSGVVVTAMVATGGGSVSGGTTAITNGSGVASFSGLIVNGLVGTKTLSFTATGLSSATSGSIALAAGAPAQLIMVTQPSATAANGAVFATQPVARVTDAGGNFVLQSGTSVTVAIASGGGSLGGSPTVSTDGSGIATFSGLSITGVAGNRTLSFSASGLTPATSNAIAITAGAAATIALNAGDAQTAAAGTAVSIAPSVLVTDLSGNPVSGTAVTFAVATGGGSVVGGAATTNASGIAAPTSWTLGTTVGGNTLTASSTGLTGSPVTFSATATAGPAAQLALTTQPSASATVGAPLGTQPVVQLQDQFGNTVSAAGTTVTASIFSGGGSVAGGTTAITSAGGAASFSGLIVNGTAGSTQVLRFSSGSLTAVNSIPITPAAGAATQIAIATQPSTTVANGAALTTQPVLQLKDAGGNNVSTSGVAIVASLTGSPAGVSLGGTTTATTNAGGTASFTNLSLSGLAGSYTLTFTKSGLTSAVSGTIALVAGAPASVTANSVTSQAGHVGVAAGTRPQVKVVDASGNPVSGAIVTFVVTAGGGSVSGATPATNAQGLATVGGWTLGKTVVTNTVTATVGALPTVSFNASPTFIVSRVAGGGAFTCAVTVDGVPYCWGDNSTGALGDNTTSPHGTPAAVAGTATFTSLTAGLGHTCGVSAAGAASCWGSNTKGQLGVGSTSQKLVPTAVTGGLTFSTVDLGTDHSCGVTTGGAVECWGANTSGQLGNGATSSGAQTSPLQIVASGFSQISSGVFYTCGTRTAGGVGNCWGINGFGQLGDSTKGMRTSPTVVKGGLIFVEVVSSQTHSCGRTSAGTVFCWGFNGQGRLAQDTLTLPGNESLVPKQVLGLSGVVQLITGQAHTCARTNASQVFCWGLGDVGQLGNGNFSNRQAPTQVALPGGVTGFSSISAGASHSCGVTSTGSLYCWGLNTDGQLGDGSGSDQPLPVPVLNP